MTLSERIIEIKNNRKLLQKDIAQAINVTVRQYQRYEKNQTQPTLSVLLALADYFDVSLEYLVGRSDNQELLAAHTADDSHDLTPEQREELEQFKQFIIERDRNKK